MGCVFNGEDMDHVVFELRRGGITIKSQIYECSDGHDDCPEPVWEWDDMYWDQYTKAKFEFLVPETALADQEYDLLISGHSRDLINGEE